MPPGPNSLRQCLYKYQDTDLPTTCVFYVISTFLSSTSTEEPGSMKLRLLFNDRKLEAARAAMSTVGNVNVHVFDRVLSEERCAGFSALPAATDSEDRFIAEGAKILLWGRLSSKSEDYQRFLSQKGQRIHVRTYWPPKLRNFNIFYMFWPQQHAIFIIFSCAVTCPRGALSDVAARCCHMSQRCVVTCPRALLSHVSAECC